MCSAYYPISEDNFHKPTLGAFIGSMNHDMRSPRVAEVHTSSGSSAAGASHPMVTLESPRTTLVEADKLIDWLMMRVR